MATTLTDFVRQHPDKKPKEIAELAIKAGIKHATPQGVSNSRHWIKKQANLGKGKGKRASKAPVNDPLYDLILRRGTETAQRMIDLINSRQATLN